MMKKFLMFVLCGFVLLGFTGCGNKKSSNVTINKDIKKYADAIREGGVGLAFGDYTLGELYDNGLKKSTWSEYTKALSSGTKKILISVKGPSKYEEVGELEVIYEVNMDDLSYKLYKVYFDGQTGSLATFLSASSEDLKAKEK